MQLDEGIAMAVRPSARRRSTVGWISIAVPRAAQEHLDRALALNPNDQRLVVQRGINLTRIGDPVAAIAWIERVMRIDPFSATRLGA